MGEEAGGEADEDESEGHGDDGPRVLTTVDGEAAPASIEQGNTHCPTRRSPLSLERVQRMRTNTYETL